MRKIDIDEDVYRYLVSHTREFGETPSDVLRRLLGLLPAPGDQGTVEESGAKPPERPATRPPPPPPPSASRSAPSPPPPPPPDSEPAAPAQKSTAPGPTPAPSQPKPAPEPASVDPKRALIHFLSSPRVADANATTRYLEILAYLQRERPRDFEEILDLGGRTRRYFARSKKGIEDSGKSTNPREIPGSDYWAMTGVDTFQKRDILRQVMEKMKYDPDSIDRCVEAVK